MATYFRCALNRDMRHVVVNEAVNRLKKVEFDYLAVRGCSGLIMGGLLSHLLDKEVIIVRKEGEQSHAFSPVSVPSNLRENGKYIILDDFVASGNTLKEIVKVVSDRFPAMKLAGLYCYTQNYMPSHEILEPLGIKRNMILMRQSPYDSLDNNFRYVPW